MKRLTDDADAGQREEDVNWWRRFNALRAIIWVAIIPVAYFMDWLASVRFVSAASLYANVASDVAAWRSDVNPNVEQLNRIEEKLDRLLAAIEP